MRVFLHIGMILGGLLCGLAAWPAAGENFRVENAVFTGNGQQPESCSTTIFDDGLVFDFLQQPAEATIFDTAAARITLLDFARRIRTEVPTSDVADLCEKFRQRAVQHQKMPLVAFMAEPKFREEFDAQNGRLTLSSPWLTYQLQLVAFGGDIAATQYREFSDWSARLNVLLTRGARPPQARLWVNEAVARHQMIAREVRLTIIGNPAAGGKEVVVRSQHKFSPKLTAEDLRRVKEARDDMTQFDYVAFLKYCRRE
jgi:hypothetical protein